MANPTLPQVFNTESTVLENTVDANTGIRYFQKNVGEATDPDVLARFIEQQKNTWLLLAKLIGGVVTALTGLNVGVYSMTYMIGATEYFYAGDETYAVTASETNYLYLDDAATLKKSIVGWPAGDHIKLAKVVADATDIQSTTHMIQTNWLTGIINAWSTVQATSNVDINNNELNNIKSFDFTNETKLTIADGAITPTQYIHGVDTEAAAATDDINTITADPLKIGRHLLLRAMDQGRVPTLKNLVGNIILKKGDAVLDDPDKVILLYQDTVGTWNEIARNWTTTKLVADLDVNSKKLNNVGVINLKYNTQLVVDGAITKTRSVHLLDVGSGTPDDELSTINGGTDGDLLIIIGGGSSPVTVKHGNNIALSIAKDMVISDAADTLTLQFFDPIWLEVSHTPWLATELIGTGKVIPVDLNIFIAGALSDGQVVYRKKLIVPLDLKQYNGSVSGSPTTATAVIRIKKGGASVHTSDSNAVNIPVASNDDDSEVMSPVISFAAGDILTVEVVTAGGASDLTITTKAFAHMVDPTL